MRFDIIKFGFLTKKTHMRIGIKRSTAMQATILLGTLTFTLNGQYYSEMMRQQQLSGGSSAQEPLTMRQLQADIVTPADTNAPAVPMAPFAGPKAVAAWSYQPEPHLEDLPPHLTRFQGMLLYYTNGTVFVVYTNPEALHHQKGIRGGDRILSVNGKNVRFYKDSFFRELNEVRPDRDLHVQFETGSPAYQRILVLPNLVLPDRKLDKLLISMRSNQPDLWPAAPQPIQIKPPRNHVPTKKPVRRRHFTHGGTSSALIPTQPSASVTLFGMKVQQQQGRLLVTAVSPRSSAASAKIQPGDEILSVSGNRASGLPADTLGQLVAVEPVLIEWMPGGGSQPEKGYFNSSPK